MHGGPRRIRKSSGTRRGGGAVTEPSRAVFLSYASQDTKVAQTLCNALRAAGIEVWFDQSELRGGDAWDQKIRQQIRDCALFVPIISAHTQARPEGYFRLEWKLAVDRSYLMAAERAFLVPVVVDATTEPEALVPTQFRDVQWARIRAGEVPAAFVDHIAALLDQPVASHASGPDRQVRPSTSRRLSTTLIAVAGTVVIALVIATVMRSRWIAPVPAAQVGATSPSMTVMPTAISEKSIAVLPFADMSEKKDQEYFADGLAEEMLDLLAKVPELEVISRTSSFSFKGKSDDIPTIAGKLHVAHILEGSVRKSGKHLRVTTQLIRASTGVHLWSETYDRDIKDIFTVQDEIASAVVAALKVRILPSQAPVNTHRTASQEAYMHYLRGLQFVRRDSDDDYRHAADEFAAAIALDPGYAAAYAGLADSTYAMADQTGDQAAFRRALEAADRSISLDPELLEGYVVRVRIRSGYSHDFAGAWADAERALALGPGDGRAQRTYAYVLSRSGRVSEAIAATRKALELDPLDARAWVALGLWLLQSGHYADAEHAATRALEISPGSFHGQYVLARTYLMEGRPRDALPIFQRIESSGLGGSGVAMAEHSLGHARESQAALDRLIAAHSADAAYQIAHVYAWRGETEEAFRWLDRAYVQRDGGLTTLKTDPILEPLRKDARYRALLKKMNLPEQ